MPHHHIWIQILFLLQQNLMDKYDAMEREASVPVVSQDMASSRHFPFTPVQQSIHSNLFGILQVISNTALVYDMYVTV